MKKLANLRGVKALNRKQQKEIFGGGDLIEFGDPGGGSGGGGDWYCGCAAGDNQPASYCVSWVCQSACIGYGGWTGVCISAG